MNTRQRVLISLGGLILIALMFFIVFSERGSELINAALASLRQAEQSLAIRIGYEGVGQLRRALMADWGPVIGERHPPGRKRSVG